MPVVGYDMVVRCMVCSETARMRVVTGNDPGVQANPYRMMAELTDSGFELDENGEYLCFRHSSGRWKSPVPVPELLKELKN